MLLLICQEVLKLIRKRVTKHQTLGECSWIFMESNTHSCEFVSHAFNVDILLRI